MRFSNSAITLVTPERKATFGWKIMKIMRLTGIRSMEMMEVDPPAIMGDSDVLVRMKTVGVCGSDIHYYVSGRIGSQVVEFPFAVGHEGAGIVEATGIGVSRVSPGDRVAIDPAMPCYECDQCLWGRHHTCRNLRFLGCPGQAEGCLAEMILMPERSLYPIPDSVSLDQAAMAEPLSIGLYAVRQSSVRPEHAVGILGFGPIGMSVLIAARTTGVDRIFVTEKIPARLSVAVESGAVLALNPDREDAVAGIAAAEPLLLDVVYECCGRQEAIDQAIDLLKPGGRLMVIGIPETDRLAFSADKMRRKEISIVNVRRQSGALQPTLDLLASGRMCADRMITHRFSLQESRSAFDLVAAYSDGVMKAMIDIG
jgi:L-iditol 2-dehydrogenase